MATFHLSYNPFLVQTSLCVLSDGKWVAVDEEAGLDSIHRKRLQHWLCEGGQTGVRFFDQLFASSGDEEIDILFSGTQEDMADLRQAANRYADRHPEMRIAVRPFDGGEQKGYGSSEKLQELRLFAEESCRSPYWALLPPDIRERMGRAFLPMPSVGIMIGMSVWETKRTQLFAPDAWQLVALRFRYDTMRERSMRASFRSFSEAFRAIGNRELERTRFLLLCVCSDAALVASLQTQDSVRKVLLEYGLYDLDVFLLSEQEIDLLDDEDASCGSSSFIEVRNAIRIYSERYAEQIRLRKLCDTLQLLLRESGFVKGNDFFRKVEETVRDGCPSATDQQVIEAYEWLCLFADRLKGFLDITASAGILTR